MLPGYGAEADTLRWGILLLMPGILQVGYYVTTGTEQWRIHYGRLGHAGHSSDTGLGHAGHSSVRLGHAGHSSGRSWSYSIRWTYN